MNSVIIFAGGTGERMKYGSKPKQFLKVYNKEILIYTIEVFENHPEIDNIIVVVLEGWIDHTHELLKKHGIKKVSTVIPGGVSAMDSQYQGLMTLSGQEKSNVDTDIVLFHDGVRPLINSDVISENILIAHQKGNAITAVKSYETVGVSSNGTIIDSVLDRNECYILRAPQSFNLGFIIEEHMKYRVDNYEGIVDSASMMMKSGIKLNIVDSPVDNIKVTTSMDYYYLRSIVSEREDRELFEGNEGLNS